MTTVLSSKGQVVVPRSVRAKLGLEPGTEFDVNTEGKAVVLTPRSNHRGARLKRDRKSGLPTFVVPKGTPQMTAESVRAALADSP